MTLNPEKYKKDKRYKDFEKDPVVAFLNESQKLVPKKEDKDKIEIVKILADKFKPFDEKVEALLPEDKRESFGAYLGMYK